MSPLTADSGAPTVTTPAPRDLWQQLAAVDANALVFQLPEWTDALCAYGRWRDASRLYKFPDGNVAVLPLVQRGNLPARLAVEASLPGMWGSGGPVAARPLETSGLERIVADLLHPSPLRLAVRPSPLLADEWSAAADGRMAATPRVVHLLDLEGGYDQVWNERFRTVTRRNVRKARRMGLGTERGTAGALIPEFYGLYEGWLARRARERRLPVSLSRLRAERLRKFELVARHLGECCRVLLARLDGRPVAALLLLVHNRHAVYWRGYSDLDLTRPTRANDLLQCLAIEEACDEGCRYYHLGESGGIQSLMAFKERFGARPHAFAEYRVERLPASRVEGWTKDLTVRLEASAMRLGRTDR